MSKRIGDLAPSVISPILTGTLLTGIGLLFGALFLSGQTAVTLSPAASPTSGQPGVTAINVTGSAFPSGTIQPSAVTVSLKPSAGGATVTTAASAVTTILGSTVRVTFTIPASISVAAPTPYLVSLSGNTTTNTTFASSNTAALTVNPGAQLLSVTPPNGNQGQSLAVTLSSAYTNFVQGSTVANFGPGISVGGAAEGAAGPVTVTGATAATAQLAIDASAAAGPRNVTVATGIQTATLSSAFNVNNGAPPVITSFAPQSGPVGTAVNITGSSFGSAPALTMPGMNGPAITLPVQSLTATTVGFIIPSGAATGPIKVTTGAGTATTALPFTVTPANTFTISASPSPATLIQGQSVALTVQLASVNGFNQLAQLGVSGLPQGITAAFKPSSITVGQSSILTLTAPAAQPVASTNISISASATVAGFSENLSALAALSVTAPTTTLLGRTVTTDALETPIAGVTVTTLAGDGNGNTTGCVNHTTISDSAGNFQLTNLPLQCTGPQLISFDGSTATSPAGTYDGVHLAFTLTSGQVTPSPVLVHLPRIDTAETFYVQQYSSSNQTHSFSSIPGVSVTVYAGTTLTLPNGTTPNPFPISVVQVLPDRLPDLKPAVPTMIGAFYLSFQPTGTHASQPVAVTYPNTLNTPPGTDMPLMVLDAAHGGFLPIGTGKVSANGAVIVPDPDPAHPGHAYGITNFDW